MQDILYSAGMTFKSLAQRSDHTFEFGSRGLQPNAWRGYLEAYSAYVYKLK